MPSPFIELTAIHPSSIEVGFFDPEFFDTHVGDLLINALPPVCQHALRCQNDPSPWGSPHDRWGSYAQSLEGAVQTIPGLVLLPCASFLQINSKKMKDG